MFYDLNSSTVKVTWNIIWIYFSSLEINLKCWEQMLSFEYESTSDNNKLEEKLHIKMFISLNFYMHRKKTLNHLSGLLNYNTENITSLVRIHSYQN